MKKEIIVELVVYISIIVFIYFSVIISNAIEDYHLFGSDSDNKIVQYIFSKESNDAKINRLGYDFIKDSLINKALDSKPISVKKEFRTVCIRYNDYQFKITHYEYTPYEQKDEWYIFCTNKNGEIVVLKSLFDCPKNRVKPETLERIKKLYY